MCVCEAKNSGRWQCVFKQQVSILHISGLFFSPKSLPKLQCRMDRVHLDNRKHLPWGTSAIKIIQKQCGLANINGALMESHYNFTAYKWHVFWRACILDSHRKSHHNFQCSDKICDKPTPNSVYPKICSSLFTFASVHLTIFVTISIFTTTIFLPTTVFHAIPATAAAISSTAPMSLFHSPNVFFNKNC